MDYCNKANQIQTYSPADNMTGNFKNIDCVSLESDAITCDTLTINGEPWDNSEIDLINQKLVNQTVSSNPASTTFSGTLFADDIEVTSGEISSSNVYCDTLRGMGTATPFFSPPVNVNAPLLINGSVTSSDSLTVTNSSTTADPVIAEFFQPNMFSGSSVKIQLGKSISTDQCGELSFNNTSSSNTNYLSLNLLGRQTSSAVRVYSTYVDVIGELRSNNFTIVPRSLSNVTTLSGAVSPTLISNIPTTATRIVIMITDMSKTTLGPIAITPYTSGSPNSCTVNGSVWGNNAASTFSWNNLSFLHLWNNASYPPENPPGAVRSFSYTIIITYMGLIGGFHTYTVDGQGSESLFPYYISMGGKIASNTAGSKITTIQLNRADTGSFISGYASVLYY